MEHGGSTGHRVLFTRHRWQHEPPVNATFKPTTSHHCQHTPLRSLSDASLTGPGTCLQHHNATCTTQRVTPHLHHRNMEHHDTAPLCHTPHSP